MSTVAEKEFLSKTEACLELGICTVTLERRIRAGKLRAYQDNADRRKIVFRASDLEKLKRPRPRS